MLIKATYGGYISGFIDDMYPMWVISLWYAYDTLLFLSHKNDSANNHLKWLMIYFEKLSRMRTNYHNSDLIPIRRRRPRLMPRYFAVKLGNFHLYTPWSPPPP
jgi:hypothetical protein